MPVGPLLVTTVNASLDLGSDVRPLARTAIASASTLRELIEAVDLLGELEQSDVDETQLVLGAIPPSVEAAFLAALRSALDRDTHILFRWEEGPGIDVQVRETPHEGSTRVEILLRTQMASEYQTAD
ncbi:MAG TPA: hypothetical protein VL961_10000 [Acidimicrobiales bacterium]|nr:hypothetical protein [Acidimicrobiales bacterium]